MTAASIADRTRSFIQENFLYMRPDVQLGTGDALLELGIIDSMGVMEVVHFLEAEFGIEIPDEEITEQNLGTLDAIAAFVLMKRLTVRVA